MREPTLDGSRPHRVAFRLAMGLLVIVALAGLTLAVWPRADPDATYEQALNALEAGRMEEAQTLMGRLARQREPTALDRGVRARLAIALGQTDQAIDALSKIPESHPLAGWAHLRIGQIESRRRRFRIAETELRRALEREPGMVEARRELIYILGLQLRRTELNGEFVRLTESTQLTPKEVWVWAMSHDLVVWTPGEHASILEEALRADPDDRWSRLALAENLRRQSRYDEASALLAALRLSDPDACAARAEIALETASPEAAAKLLDQGPTDHPRLASIRGRLALGRGDAEAAVRDFNVAFEADPELRRTRSDLGRALLAAGQDKEASPYLNAVREIDALNNKVRNADGHLDGPNPDLWRSLAQAAESAGRRSEARSWYLLIVARDPLDTPAQGALFRLGSPSSGR